MSPTLTRRGLVQAGAAALGATVAGIPAAGQTADRDLALRDLIARHAEAETECLEAEDAADLLFSAALCAYPSRPDALNWHPEDFPRSSYGRAASDALEGTDARAYLSRGAEWLRRLRSSHLSAEAEARRVEIVEAWDKWQAECREIERRLGYTAAVQRRQQTQEVLGRTFAAIHEATPHTLDGLRLKAGWVAEQLSGRVIEDDLGEAFARQVAAFGQVTS